MPSSDDRVLWLVGMMGSGKTTVGESAAAALGLSFVDTDVLISSVSSRSIPDLWAEDGEEAFRRLERQMVVSASSSGPAVVATGGGVVLSDENTAAMRGSGMVIWLSASPETLAQRIADDGGRPLLAGESVDLRLGEILAERRTHYRAAAHVEIPTDGRDVDEIVSEVIAAWRAF